MARRHKDVEFAVDDAQGEEHIFKTWDEASGFAVSVAVAQGDGRGVNLDVLVYSKAGARSWSGDYGVEQYEDDPDASVFDRVIVKAEYVGRVR